MNASWGFFVARLISAIGSWLDASNLRNRVYKLENDNEILRTALDDIERISPDSMLPAVRYRLVFLLAQTLMAQPKNTDWLSSIERARVAYPRWPELQFLAGMVCWQHALWGKAQQMLEPAADQLAHPEMQRQAWRTLALLAEHKEETARAQFCWRRAAEVVIG